MSLPPPSPALDELFSSRNLVAWLSAKRAQLSRRRGHALTSARHYILGDEPAPSTSSHSLFYRVLPPRSAWKWHERRVALNAEERISKAIFCATMAALDDRTNSSAWLPDLKAWLNNVRERIAQPTSFRFSDPVIIPKEKGKRGLYRPLAVLQGEDAVIDCQVARYLREVLDPLFAPCVYSFRASGEKNGLHEHHAAFAALQRFRATHQGKSLYVAECDLQSFFDCISHARLKAALGAAVDRLADQGTTVDGRAIAIFHALLDAYQFPGNVLRYAERQLQERCPGATFSWPATAMETLYPDGVPDGIGLPQGCALSNVAANLLLDAADQKVLSAIKASGGSVCYIRYCDDMLIVATDRTACAAAFEAYVSAVRDLCQPIHLPSDASPSTAEFASAKSRHVYRWEADGAGSTPWVSFVGYALRYSGEVQIAERSLLKHRRKIAKEVNVVASAVRKTAQRHPSYRNTTGRLQPWQRAVYRQLKARLQVGETGILKSLHPTRLQISWLGSFPAITPNEFLKRQLRELDRFRHQQLAFAKRCLLQLPPYKATKRRHHRGFRYLGAPFSLLGHLGRIAAHQDG